MSLSLPVYGTNWKKISDLVLDQAIFSQDSVVPSLVHEYVVMYLANQRQSNAHTKTRSEVRSSWRKLYRQKWTWSARVWDAASPIRRKWWVVFGPRNERNYSKTMTKKMRIRALQSAVVLKASDQQILILDWFEHTGRTKDFAKVISALPIKSSVLVVLPSSDELAYKWMRNISRLNVTYSDVVNPYDFMSHTNVIFISWSFEQMITRVA